MAQSVLNVEVRENTGKGVARKLRAAGKIPAVVYGRGMDPCPVTVSPKDIEKAVETEAGWNTLLKLKGVPAVEGKVVILKELDMHPLRGDMICADFHVIDLKQKGSFMVPVQPVGKSAGEKAGGSLQVIRHELEVLCLPSDVPQSVEIDVAHMEIGDVVHINDIPAPAGVEFPSDVNFTVITVIGHKPEEDEDETETMEEVVEEETE